MVQYNLPRTVLITMLHVGVSPSDIDVDMGQQVQVLCQSGCSRQHLVQGVVLLLDIEGSTHPVEQGHGSCAVVHKLHQELRKKEIALQKKCGTIKILGGEKLLHRSSSTRRQHGI